MYNYGRYFQPSHQELLAYPESRYKNISEPGDAKVNISTGFGVIIVEGWGGGEREPNPYLEFSDFQNLFFFT